MAKKNTPQKQKALVKKKNWLSIFDKDRQWDDKDEVLDTVYWGRQIVAILIGIVWGILGVTGSVGIGLFAILNSIAAYAIGNYTGYEFDSDESFLTVKEGFMTTFATFLVTWIVTYTAKYFS